MTSDPKKSKGDALSAQDRELWESVKKTVSPLGTDARGDAPTLKPRKMIERIDRDRDLPSDWYQMDGPTPRTEVDRKTRRRIAKGNQDVDRSVDLHGMTQDQAYLVLKRAIESGIKRGDKTLLIVTGKGGKRYSQTSPTTPVAYRTRDEFDQHGGTLRKMVPIWLTSPELKPFVESFGPAAQDHGGDGALYILLRRRIPGSRAKKAT